MFIKIKNYQYEIIEVDNTDKDFYVDNDLKLYGQTNYENQVIKLYKNLSYARKRETLIHELTHAFFDVYLGSYHIKDKFDEEDNHYYIKNNYEYIRIDCVKAINDMSAIIVENSLNKYMNLYRDYIDCIKESIGNYTYEDSYQQTHSLFRIKAYDFLEFIYNDIIDYSRMIVQKKECALMNEIISLLYSMILYSYEKKELLSMQYLYNLYNYLNMQSLKLDKKDSYSKIKLEIFEFINYIK